MIGRPRISTLFPYTTLFRSDAARVPLHVRTVGKTVLADRGRRLRNVIGVIAAVPVDRVDQQVVVRRALELRLPRDRKSTRLNSSHLVISYAVFCLKKNNSTV